jgi:iron complex outermembrane receptor protein/hemoglobin/transferrin/lactoferrin receptor protein
MHPGHLECIASIAEDALSMSKSHHASCVASGLLALAAAFPVLAQSPSARDTTPSTTDSRGVDLSPLVVTGTRGPKDPRFTPADVDVLAGAEKRSRQTPSLGGTLEALPGVTSIGTGSQVGKPVIRGFSGNRIRILSNNVGLDFQQYGVRHPPNLDPFIADRIEVVRGASSLLYGSDAIGGAVNILPATPPRSPSGEFEWSGRATGGYASAYRETTGALDLDAARGPFGLSTTLVGRDADGLVVPDEPTALETGEATDPLVTGEVPFSDYRQINGDLNLGYTTDAGAVVARWEAYRSEQNYVVPDPPPPDGDPLQAGGIAQNLENDIVQIRGDFGYRDPLTWQPSLTYVRNLREANPGPPEPQPRSELPEAIVIDIEREQWTARLDALHGPMVAGIEGRFGAEVMRADQESRGDVGLTPGGRVTNVALFGLEGRDFGPWTVNLGGRIDYRRTEADPDKTADPKLLAGVAAEDLDNDYVIATGSLGAVYRVTPRLAVAGNLGRGFRAPSLFDLYVNGVHGGVAAFQRGNPDLDPETSFNADLSLRWQTPRWRMKWTGYAYRINNFIFLEDTGEFTDPQETTPIFQVSQDDADLYGTDATVTGQLRPWLQVSSTAEWVIGELDEGGEVPLLPPFRFRSEGRVERDRWGIFREAFTGLTVRYTPGKDAAGPQEPFSQFDAPPPPFGTASTEDYVLLDWAAGLRWRDTALRITADNLLDRDYVDFLDTYKNITLGPGRNIRIQLSQTF